MRFFAVGEDKSFMDVTEIVLALAGGAMTGNIAFKGSKSTNEMIRFLDNTRNGDGNGISIGGGGLTIIGSGESAQNLQGNYYPDTEMLVLASDNSIDFIVGVQGGNNAKTVTLNTNGLLSGHQKAITYGTAAPSGGSNGDIYIQY